LLFLYVSFKFDYTKLCIVLFLYYTVLAGYPIIFYIFLVFPSN